MKRQQDRLFFCDKNHDDGVDAVSARARGAVVRGAQERAQIDPGHLREGLHAFEGRRRHSPHDARRHLRRPEAAQRVHLGRGAARRRLQARRRARREPRPAALPRGAAPAPFRARARRDAAPPPAGKEFVSHLLRHINHGDPDRRMQLTREIIQLQTKVHRHRFQVDACVRINRWFGTSRPNFEIIQLGQIEVDSADFWTDRVLSSSRSTAEELVSNTRTLKSA